MVVTLLGGAFGSLVRSKLGFSCFSLRDQGSLRVVFQGLSEHSIKVVQLENFVFIR